MELSEYGTKDLAVLRLATAFFEVVEVLVRLDDFIVWEKGPKELFCDMLCLFSK